MWSASALRESHPNRRHSPHVVKRAMTELAEAFLASQRSVTATAANPSTGKLVRLFQRASVFRDHVRWSLSDVLWDAIVPFRTNTTKTCQWVSASKFLLVARVDSVEEGIDVHLAPPRRFFMARDEAKPRHGMLDEHSMPTELTLLLIAWLVLVRKMPAQRSHARTVGRLLFETGFLASFDPTEAREAAVCTCRVTCAEDARISICEHIGEITDGRLGLIVSRQGAWQELFDKIMFASNHTCSAVRQLRIEVIKRTTCSLNTELAGDRFRVDNYVDLFRQQKGKRRTHVDESFRVHCINSVVEKKRARAGKAYLVAVDTEINTGIVYAWVKKDMDSYADAMCRCTSETPTVLGVASDAARLGADPCTVILVFHFVLPELHA